MRVVLQRVKSASVTVAGEVCAQIGTGLLLYIGVAVTDGPAELKYIADKIPNLRVFPDAEDKMNLSLEDVNGSLLAVSQFTLMGDTGHGRRPGFSEAMAPQPAKALYEELVTNWQARGIDVKTGIFQADMLVSSVNWGPVTFIIESKK